MRTTATHLRIGQNIDCRGRHMAAGEIVAVASLSEDQLTDLLIDQHGTPCDAPAEAPQREAAEAPPATEAAALPATRARRTRTVSTP